MYSIFVFLVIIGVALIFAGVIGKMGSDASFNPSADIGTALALLVTYVIFIMCFSSFNDLSKNYGAFISGIPGVELISEYGSVLNGIHSDPVGAATAFVNAVILSMIVSILEIFFAGDLTKYRSIIYRIFIHIFMGLAGLLILNLYIKNTGIYHSVVLIIGIIISVATVGSISLTIISAIKRNTASGIFALAAIIFLTRSKVAGIFRSAFFKAVIYFAGVIFIEQKFGSISNGLLTLSNIMVAFGPVVVIFIGLALIIKMAFAR